MDTTSTTTTAATAAAQSIIQKVTPAALEDALNGLRSLSINFDTLTTTTTQTSTASNDNNAAAAAAAAAKKFCIPFDTIIESTDKGEKPFIACYYNKVSSTGTTTRYRSPWTNAIHPKVSTTETTTKTNEKLRSLEKSFNDVWESYKNLYYGHGDAISSVYLKELSNASFQGMFGIRKRIVTNDNKTNNVSKWDSVSYVIVDEVSSDNKECTYRVETYVRVVLVPTLENNNDTNTDISVSMSKETITTIKVYPDKIPINVSHIENVGTIIEENEMELRSVMESVYVPKNYETLCTLQKQPQPAQVLNPVMNLMMNSNEFKKRSEQQQQQSAVTTTTTGSGIMKNNDTTTTSSSSSSAPMRSKGGIPSGGINPLMASAMNSKILLKKRQEQQE
jgi:F-actin capping protein, beta subunit